MITYLAEFIFRLRSRKQFCSKTFPLVISIRNETHYDVLKLPRTCTTKEIRDAFISLSKENHPDKNRDNPSLHLKFVKINEAYRTLSKPSSRRAYDMTLSTRRINPTSQGKTSSQFYSEYDDFRDMNKHDFHNPNYWYNAKDGDRNKSNHDNYYGVKGIKKVSNSVVLWCLFAFTVVGVLLQVVIITMSADLRNNYMTEETKKNSLIESMLKEKARLYGNDHQIQVLKNSLKATYKFVERDSVDLEASGDGPIEGSIKSPGNPIEGLKTLNKSDEVKVSASHMSAGLRNNYMTEYTKKNSLIESMLKEKARRYGNEHQIQVLKNSLKAFYMFKESDSVDFKASGDGPVEGSVISPRNPIEDNFKTLNKFDEVKVAASQ